MVRPNKGSEDTVIVTQAVVIGGGPAGLMAAEMLADGGVTVTVVDAKPTVGRKLLMAGKSGLNLTKDEPFERFAAQYDEAASWLEPILRGFDNSAVQKWANELGQAVFTGSTGRVFPEVMKASPLLRAWLARLDAKGVQFLTRWRWAGWQDNALAFETRDGVQHLKPEATVLALGGASWPRLGSDGLWVPFLRDKGVEIAPFQPANMGFLVNWSDHMAPVFGLPVKNCVLNAGDLQLRGEFVISSKGLEGGGIYAVSKKLRQGASLVLDLLPDLELATVASRLAKSRGKNSLSNHLRKTLRMGRGELALLQELGRPLPQAPVSLAKLIKNLPVSLIGPKPIEEAISTAGGIAQNALTEELVLKGVPGIFCAGEMLDWEAPTGGYLLSACLATGRAAGLGAVRYLSASGDSS